MANKFYITTPIYYVNAAPHIGHSYTNIAADVLSRQMRVALGEDSVWFLTGTDEHGQKIKKAADEAGLEPQEFVDKVGEQFKALWVKLSISNNDFIRTTQERHKKTVQRFLDILYKNGDIYEATYNGWYCTPCETFWPETQLTEQVCPDCKRGLEKISEKNYFFKLSKYQDWLIKHIKENKNFVRPENRHNEILSFLEGNVLNDLCISRPRARLSWGIPLPFSPDHVTYVWFDALINYISAVGSFDEAGKYISKWWGEDSQVVHLIGKDILRHHAVYWPIMLHAVGIALPKEMTIFAHGWWLMGDAKMSKSKGNVVAPLDMADKYGIDTYRYFLLRDVPFGMDGNFSENAIIKRFNGDLANDLGNLVYRTLTMIEKYYQGAVPDVDIHKLKLDEFAEAIKLKLKPDFVDKIISDLRVTQDFNFSLALGEIWELINLANKYVEQTKPWNLAKENKIEELKIFIRLLVDVIRATANYIQPFMPLTAKSIKEQLGQNQINKGNPLFPRIEIEQK